MLARNLARTDRRPEALEIADRFRRTDADPYGLALVYVALGDMNTALDQLTKAYERRVGFVRWNNVDPMWDDVRLNPRFQALVARLKLPSTGAR